MDQASAQNAKRQTLDQAPGWISRLKRPRVLVTLGGLLVVLLVLASWLHQRAQFVSTNDARVAADMVAVSADVSGRIIATAVSTGDRVSEGDLIYEIDSREAKYLLEEYAAEAASLTAQIERENTRFGLVGSKSGTQVDVSRADIRSAQATLSAARTELENSKREHERARGLFESGFLTQGDWDRAQTRFESARQDVLVAEADVSSAQARQREAVIATDDTVLVAQDLKVLEAALQRATAQYERQKVVVDQHFIRSPITGVVDELFFDTGGRTLEGFRAALLHDPNAVWIAANIKETQVRHVVPGAAVRVHVDSDPRARVHGTVSVVRDLTLAEAALMRNPNATGVFTKITQRIPVRIDLEQADTVLRPGSMVRVSIARDTGEDRAE